MPAARPALPMRDILSFQAPYAPADEGIAAALLGTANAGHLAAEARIDARASRLIEAIRARRRGLGGIEDFLHAYSLSTKEGLALMVLAEALLRVPDAATADRLIEDKLAAGDWSHHDGRSTALLVSASAWTLGITARIIQPGETPEGIVEALVKRLGVPAVRAATRQAMRLLGSHFVLGQTIDEAPGARRHSPRIPLLLRHAGRGRAHRPPTPSAILPPMPAPSRRSANPPVMPACRSGRAFRSSCRRCIRATRRFRANGCSELVPRLLELARRPKVTTSISPSMPRRPTGSNSRST